MKRKKKSPKDLLRSEADHLLQQWVRLKYKWCLVCGEDLYAGHHYIPKARSNALRYYLGNIIPICRNCHSRIHSQPWLVNPIIDFQKGSEWYDDLMRAKQEPIKENKYWYQEKIDHLKQQIKDAEMEKI